jgi:excinuclease UvrABC ATPase subunit
MNRTTYLSAAAHEHFRRQWYKTIESDWRGYTAPARPARVTARLGRNQPVKLAANLAQATCEGTLFIFDEPTTGLWRQCPDHRKTALAQS